MFYLVLACLIRIFSNSYLNVIQKVLTLNGEKSSVINFYSYLGLFIISLFTMRDYLIFNQELLLPFFIMGALGALGNYYIIKALSIGELSTLAPINSYKPIVALFWGILILKEYPSCYELFAILLIILGTLILTSKTKLTSKTFLYRFLALIFSGTEAIFIKKIIIISNISSAFFYWAFAGLIFSCFFINKTKMKLSKTNIKYQILLIILISIMQFSTNYVFSKMNTAYALAIFQLSGLLSIYMGINIFKEKNLFIKIVASIIMITGAILLILR